MATYCTIFNVNNSFSQFHQTNIQKVLNKTENLKICRKI